MANYYNEIDKFAANWLRELIKKGLIPEGEVDERDIRDVAPADLAGFTQCHFFAGIGGWPLALALAGWPSDRPVWTGSCPCQPFSAAGKGNGFDDERHLWPDWFWLIQQRKPSIIFGEQVSGKNGRVWLDLVSTDLENSNYSIGALDIPAASVGAPHKRQRHYWVAELASIRRRGWSNGNKTRNSRQIQVEGRSSPGALSDSRCRSIQYIERCRCNKRQTCKVEANTQEWKWCWIDTRECCSFDSLSNFYGPRCEFIIGSKPGLESWNDINRRGPIYIICKDGKAREVPTEPAFQPLVNGLPAGGLGILRGSGNAIIPKLAAEFISAYLEVG